MSGVGLTGLIKDLPGTVTPYPVWEDVDGLGGWMALADLAARDALPANYRKIGRVVVTQDTGVAYELVGGILNTDWVPLSFTGANPGLVSDWYLDAAGGNDANNGQSPGAAVQTSERLSQLICPNGTKTVFAQNTTIHVAAGTYGNLYLNTDWIAGTGSYGLTLTVLCAVSTGSPILLSAVTATNPAGPTSGEVTSVAGVFTAGQRLRVTTGVQTDSLAYCTGQHASVHNQYVGPWLRFADASQSSPAPGDSVVVDTLLVTFDTVTLPSNGYGYTIVQDAHIGSFFSIGTTQNELGSVTAPYLFGCVTDGTSGGFANFGLFQSVGGFTFWSCNIIDTPTVSGDHIQFTGCRINGVLNITGASPDMLWGFGNVHDAASVVFAQFNEGGSGVIKFASPTEHCNGAGLTAYNLAPNCSLLTGVTMWGAAGRGSYASKVTVATGAWVYCSPSVAQWSLPSVVDFILSGTNIAVGGCPANKQRANCGIAIVPDVTAAINTT